MAILAVVVAAMLAGIIAVVAVTGILVAGLVVATTMELGWAGGGWWPPACWGVGWGGGGAGLRRAAGATGGWGGAPKTQATAPDARKNNGVETDSMQLWHRCRQGRQAQAARPRGDGRGQAHLGRMYDGRRGAAGGCERLRRAWLLIRPWRIALHTCRSPIYFGA